MKRIAFKSLVVAAFSLFVSAAVAEPVSVPSGKATQVDYFFLYDSWTCQNGAKSAVSFKQPANGTLSSKWGKQTIKDKGACNGKSMNVLLIYYKSKVGYHGQDSGKYSVSFASYVNGSVDTSQSFNVNVQVK